MISTTHHRWETPAMHPDSLRTSMEHCRRVTRQQAKNFYYGLMLTPQPKRASLYAIYAWMRTADDLADEPGDIQDKIARLEAFRSQTTTAIDPASSPDTSDHHTSRHDPIWPALRKTVIDYQIPHEYFYDMIDGQLLDQHRFSYESFDQLDDYCYKVASVVGLACITIWGYQGGDATRTLAQQRGVALQLTNIIRDLVEDARRDRVYLPLQELARFGYDRQSFIRCVLQGQPDTAFDQLLAFQITRAKHYYELSDSLDSHIAPPCQPTSRTLMTIYRRLFDKIAARPRMVLQSRVRLSPVEKVWITLQGAVSRSITRKEHIKCTESTTTQ